ncbi:MAG: hypothetical protein WBD20_21470 [Pirellulaceae bacterium]
MKHRRNAYTLIELLAAMIAASALLASLAGTIVVSTHLLESSPTSHQAWKDREIADRIASDLRFASSVDESPTYGFAVSKPNVSTGTSETANYQLYQNGMTRQIDSATAYVLDDQAPSHAFTVDGYSAPTYVPNTDSVRVRSSSSSVSSGAVTSITVDYPPGCVNGDFVVMAISARSPNSLTFTPSNWSLLYFSGNNNLRLVVAYGVYDDSQSSSTQVNFTDGPTTAAVAIIAIENASISSPANWANSGGGYAWNFLTGTHPEPLEPSTGTLPHHLHLQIFAADGEPWSDFGETLGIASYADVVQASAGSNSIGIAARVGSQPVLSTTPRAWQRTSGRWLQAGLRIGGEL